MCLSVIFAVFSIYSLCDSDSASVATNEVKPIGAAERYLLEGSEFSHRSVAPCDDFYEAVCSKYTETFRNETTTFELMNSETKIMREIIKNFGSLMENYSLKHIRDPKFRHKLNLIQRDLLEHYSYCKTQPKSTDCGSGAQISENRDAADSSNYGHYSSFKEYGFTAFCYLRNWSLSETCAYDTMEKFPATAGHIYISEIHGWKAAVSIRKSGLDLVPRIKSALTSILVNQNWIDWSSKRQISKDIEELKIEIGFSDWHTNGSEVQRKCVRQNKTMNTNSDYFDCSLSILSTESEFENSKFSLFIPFGILMEPIFHEHYPSALKFGILGQKIAENIVRVLLQNSNMHYSTDCGPESLKDKAERANSIFKLFMGSFRNENKDPKILTNSDFHRIELGKSNWNFASFLGLKTALVAYRHHAVSEGISELLPNLAHITDEQTVLASFTRSQCAFISPIAMEKYLNPSPYHIFFLHRIPPPVKVHGIMLLMKEFAGLFQCSKYSLYDNVLVQLIT